MGYFMFKNTLRRFIRKISNSNEKYYKSDLPALNNCRVAIPAQFSGLDISTALPEKTDSLKPTPRVVKVDVQPKENELKQDVFDFFVFVRLSGKKIKFSGVSFKYVFFESCYLRDCIFDSCDFTGAKFIDSNLVGSTFTRCKFDYTSFQKTHITTDILHTEAPIYDNLKQKFARELRLNYQQVGDNDAVNAAINLELKATQEHLYKSWSSRDTYYRKKYPGIKRISQFVKWTNFKVLDFIWGNGESLFKFFKFVAVCLFFISIVNVFMCYNPLSLPSYWDSFIQSPSILLGTFQPTDHPIWFKSLAMFLRLTLFGFFIAILNKRLSRR